MSNQERYERSLILLATLGGWLMGPEAEALPEETYREIRARFNEGLDRLDEMKRDLRPIETAVQGSE